MDSNTSSSKKEGEEEDNATSREATPRTSISSNDSNFIIQSPGVINDLSNNFTPSRHSIDELRDLHQLSRRTLSRRLSTLSAASSFGDVGDGTLNWNPREAGVNAISNVLSNAQTSTARKRVSKPTNRDIPTVTLTNLPIVTYASFEPYLSSIGPDYERHRRFKQGLLEEHIRIGSTETSVVPASPFTDLIDSKFLANISTSNLSASSLDDTIQSPSLRRRPFRNREEEPESLENVPSVFFDSNFSLSNPRIFDIVNENSDLLARTGTGKPDRKSLASNAILQEKLSWYMDTVEIHLIKEINAASASFFAALSDLQELNEDASKCVATIARLREELGRIQDMHALQGADVTKLHIKRANVARLQQAVDLVGKVSRMKNRIEDLLEQKENGQAYQLMQDIKGMMESSDSDSTSINLRRVEALRNIDAEMANVLSRIGNSQGNDLTKTLITDLRTWVNSTNTQATLRRLSETFNRDTQRKEISKISSPAQITVPDDVRKTVIQQLDGLQQTRFLETGMELYRKEIVKEVKGVIKKNLPSMEDDTESVMSSFTGNQPSDRKERSQALAKNLRQMAPETFLEMITTTYASLAEFFRRLQTHQKLLLDLTALSGTVPADLSEVLNNIIDISSSRITKILGVRAEQNSHLAPREFYVFIAATRLFSLECERISGKAPTVLMTTVNSQARGFVSWLHLDRTKLLGAAIDRDKWKSEDILAVTQKQTGLIVESATRDPISWVKFVRVDSLENVNGVNTNEKVEKTLTIEEEKFFIVGCVVVLLGILEEYCIALIALPPLQSDITANLIEVLKLYNSRVMQSILRAGATKTAGLKSIMARHLAFASQALGAIISLIPYIREYARRHLGNTNPSIAEFDRTKRALQVHQDEIHTKLISIMDDRLKAHARSFDKLDWESFPEGKQVHAYAETVVAETSTLHNVLKRYLSPMVVEMIMEGVFASYISRLTDEYIKIEKSSAKVKETMLADATYITEKLSQLSGVREMDRGLIQAVETREVSATSDMEDGTKETSTEEVLFDAANEMDAPPKDTV